MQIRDALDPQFLYPAGSKSRLDVEFPHPTGFVCDIYFIE